MKVKLVFTMLFVLLICQNAASQQNRFEKGVDLLLAQFDCKTDVDDLHTVAALTTLLKHRDFKDVQYHAVAGTYGIQEGLYVPAEPLFDLAFGTHWSDAHNTPKSAQQEVLNKVNTTILKGGDIWIADAGQSDFSAKWIKALLKMQPRLDVKKRIHLVQHSNWNEEVTASDLLDYVKENIDYHKIPDGNAVGNGTPGFRSDEKIKWRTYLKNRKHLKKVWELAISTGNEYNGRQGRYLNESIAAGGLDFSDLSEICYILGLEGIKDGNAFFEMISAP
ncbi:MAG: hypothetical protein AAGC45_04630 [Bacteroidota bacterium]